MPAETVGQWQASTDGPHLVSQTDSSLLEALLCSSHRTSVKPLHVLLVVQLVESFHSFVLHVSVKRACPLSHLPAPNLTCVAADCKLLESAE